jgi:hypothetical protein
MLIQIRIASDITRVRTIAEAAPYVAAWLRGVAPRPRLVVLDDTEAGVVERRLSNVENRQLLEAVATQHAEGTP